MIALSDNLKKELQEQINLSNFSDTIDEQVLKDIQKIRLSKNDLSLLRYFVHLEELELDVFPSINQQDVDFISQVVPHLKSLKIQEQNAIFELDITSLKELERLTLIHNDNLVKIHCGTSLKQFVFYDNKEFRDVSQLIELLSKTKDCHFVLDIVYYVEIVRTLLNIPTEKDCIFKISWIESIGLRKFKIHEYTTEELQYLVDFATYVTSKYIFVTDGVYEKFGILYRWMIQNIQFVNEDDPKESNLENVNSIIDVFKYKKGGRLSYAKAFQLLLRFVDISSTVVYSMGALEKIGYYNGKNVYSLLGTSDYSLLRVELDYKYYYCDIAWDSLVDGYKYFDVLRLFLVSKEELRLRHKFVGEGNIEHTYSYHGDDSDDLLMFSNDRIKEVDDILADVEREKPLIDGAYVNSQLLHKNLDKMQKELEEMDTTDSNYRLLSKQIEEIKEEIEVEETNYVRYLNLRENIIKSYSNYFMRHYLGTSLMSNKNDLIELLKVKKYNFTLSDYMFSLLNECIKTA